MKKYLVLLALWGLVSTVNGSWRNIYPLPEVPAKEKALQDYTVKDVWRCIIDRQTKGIFPEGHPFLKEGMEGIKKSWKSARSPKKAREMILLAIDSAQEYAKKKEANDLFKGDIRNRRQSLVNLSEVLRDGFALTDLQKREELLNLAKNEQDKERKLLLVYTCILVARETLDVELLKYGSEFMQESLIAYKKRTRHEEVKLYIERSYGQILSAEIKIVVDLIQTKKLDDTSALPTLNKESSKELQTWLASNWSILEEKAAKRKEYNEKLSVP